MNYGFYMATAGMLSGSHRMDIASNNLANLETPGFKVDVAMIRSRDTAREEDGLHHLPSNELLERLGGGVLPWPTRIDFDEAGVEITNDPLDVAVRGEGFLAVLDESDPEGNTTRLTRDGRLALRPDGTLVTRNHSRPVLDEGGREIRLDPAAPVEFAGDGAVKQHGAVVARLMVASVADPQVLEKAGDGLYRGPASVMASLQSVENPRVTPGAIERSGTDPIDALNAVRSAGGMVSRNARMIDIHNDAMQMAISRLGRTS